METGVTVDVVLLTLRAGRLRVLLVERTGPPYPGAWALPGGFLGPGEDLDAAARRLLVEETGLRPPGHLEQLRSYGRPDRDPRLRVVSVAYLGLGPNLPAPANAARWWAVEDLEEVDLAFDHAEILADGVERARAKLEYSPLATAFVEEPFTLADLRRVYEAAWGGSLDPANFRRKVLSTPGFVLPVGARAAGRGGRPAELYRRGAATTLFPPLLRRSV
jgi:8-oxo-dGTP diphosphatase